MSYNLGNSRSEINFGRGSRLVVTPHGLTFDVTNCRQDEEIAWWIEDEAGTTVDSGSMIAADRSARICASPLEPGRYIFHAKSVQDGTKLPADARFSI